MSGSARARWAELSVAAAAGGALGLAGLGGGPHAYPHAAVLAGALALLPVAPLAGAWEAARAIRGRGGPGPGPGAGEEASARGGEGGASGGEAGAGAAGAVRAAAKALALPGRCALALAGTGALAAAASGAHAGLAAGNAATAAAVLFLTLVALAWGARGFGRAAAALYPSPGLALAAGALPGLLLVGLPLALAPITALYPLPPELVARALHLSPLTALPHALFGVDLLKADPLYAWLSYAQGHGYVLPGAPAALLELGLWWLAPGAAVSVAIPRVARGFGLRRA